MSDGTPFFILGMRRSGTSILREIIASHPEVDECLFEPHDLWHAIMMDHFKRFEARPYVREILNDFETKPGLHGAKFVFNPGVEALEWVWLERKYKPKFIFIIRDQSDVFASYAKQDRRSVRGMVSEAEHLATWLRLSGDWMRFPDEHGERACLIRYEDLLTEPNATMRDAWRVLGVSPDHDIARKIRMPEHRKGLAKCSA